MKNHELGLRKTKDHTLQIRISSDLWQRFQERCAEVEPEPVTPAVMIRTLMADWLKRRQQRGLPGIDP